MYRLSLLFDADDAGATKARDLAKTCLEKNGFSPVRTVTVMEWMFLESTRKLPVMSRNGQPFVEHRAAHECGHRRRFV